MAPPDVEGYAEPDYNTPSPLSPCHWFLELGYVFAAFWLAQHFQLSATLFNECIILLVWLPFLTLTLLAAVHWTDCRNYLLCSAVGLLIDFIFAGNAWVADDTVRRYYTESDHTMFHKYTLFICSSCLFQAIVYLLLLAVGAERRRHQ